MMPRTLIQVVATITILTLLVGAVWLSGGIVRDYDDISPDGSYRLVVYTPSRLQRLSHLGYWDPGFTRIYRVRDGKLLRNGPVVDFLRGDGDVMWLNAESGEVTVGMHTRFYHLPPLDAQGRPLPIKHEAYPPRGG